MQSEEQAHHNDTEGSINGLTGGVLSHVVRLTEDLLTILNSRRSCTLLREPAAAAVTELQAENATMPPDAWDVFPCATKLRTNRTFKDMADRTKSDADYLANVVQLLSDLPDRTNSIVLGSFASDSWDAEQSRTFAKAVVASACSGTLEHLEIEVSITSEGADIIFNGLPSLKHAVLNINGQHPASQQTEASSDKQQTWRPSVHLSNLTSLTINASSTYIDLSGISGATKLKKLSLRATVIINQAAISSLTCLQELSLSYLADMRVLEALQELQHLDLIATDCSAAGWQVLASLPKLQSVTLASIPVTEASSPSHSITSLSASIHFQLAQPQQSLPGCLARMLPSLQQLEVMFADLQQIALAMQGHAACKSLSVRSDPTLYAFDDAEWPQQLLSQLPALEELVLSDFRIEAAALLADVASCSRLTSLEFDMTRCRAHLTGLAALASGLCSQTLESVEIHGVRKPFMPAAVAELLTGSMRRLKRVVVYMTMPVMLQSDAEVEQQVPGILRDAGAVVQLRCRCQRLYDYPERDQCWACCLLELM